MMTFDRRPVQIVEIDIEYCPHVYGDAPCMAALGVTGERKCYNTWKTCQAPINFNAPLEPTGGPDRTYDDGDTLTSADFSRSADYFFAADMMIPSAPTGVVWELGGLTGAAYLGFTSGELVFRAGNAGSGHPTGTAKVAVDPFDILNKSGTIYGQIDMTTSTVSLWWRNKAETTVTLLGEDTAVTPFAAFASTSDGAVGRLEGLGPVGEDGTDYNGSIYKYRAYDSTAFEPVDAAIPLKTLRYSQNQNGTPKGVLIYPALTSPVKTNPASLNLGGIDDTTGPLGKRARVTVNFQDFPDSDIALDKYQAERRSGAAQTDEGGYDPFARGTHFGKLRSRFPYYEGRALRVLEGYEGQALSAMRTRNYVITAWVGPDASGRVTITAKDILDLAENKKAVCPTPSNGKLAEEIEADFRGEVSLIPETIGAEYGASGRICVGSEIMTYTRAGDVLTITARGVDGSEASAHSMGDLAQECYRANRTPLQDVAADLLINYAGISPDWIPTAEWDVEADRWLAGFDLTATITKPTGVTTLIGELARLGVMFWWDDVAQEVKLRPNRPLEPGESAAALTDEKNVLAGTLQSKGLEEQRVSRVVLWHGVLDMTNFSESGEMFSKATVAGDFQSETSIENNQMRIFEIFCRWLGGSGDESIASAVTARYLGRYETTPQQVAFDVDIKDIDSVILGGAATLTSRTIQDDTGNSLPTEVQITAIEEVQSGHRLRITTQTFQFSGRFGLITEDARPDYDLSTPEEIAEGTYIVDGDTLLFPDGTGPYIIF